MAEYFKGIEFVRISSLPEDQKRQIWQSFQQDKIIKIVKDQSLMNDCILYNDYLSWLDKQQEQIQPIITAQSKPLTSTAKSASVPAGFTKLAFK